MKSFHLLKLLSTPMLREEQGRKGIKTTLLVSAFVTLFLYIFQPFGINELDEGKFLLCLGFGGSMFLAIVLYNFLVDRLLRNGEWRLNWTFGKWLLNNLGLVLAISLANFLFARLVIFGYIRWDLFPQMLYGTFMVGIIPFAVLGWRALVREERELRSEITEFRRKSPTTVSASAERLVGDLPLSRIRYVRALQNYATIGYLAEPGRVVETTVRTTLKEILELAQGSPLVRCHRSYLVARNHILDVEGNAQGLALTVADCTETVPVSRSYVARFRSDKRG